MQTTITTSVRALRNLYLTRTVFQLIWAAAVTATAATEPQFAAILLILYPLWDVTCTVYDLKTSAQTKVARTSQTINIVLGVAAALAIAVTVFNHTAYAIAIFGGWALAAGLLQLVVAGIRRLRLGGQWALILSGAQSALAGIAFLIGGLNQKFQTKDLAGYALFGAIYFLVSAILLSRQFSKVGPPRGAGTQVCISPEWRVVETV